MTNGWVDIKNTDVILAMGGNPAENHPVGFKWFLEARKVRNCKLVAVLHIVTNLVRKFSDKSMLVHPDTYHA